MHETTVFRDDVIWCSVCGLHDIPALPQVPTGSTCIYHGVDLCYRMYPSVQRLCSNESVSSAACLAHSLFIRRAILPIINDSRATADAADEDHPIFANFVGRKADRLRSGLFPPTDATLPRCNAPPLRGSYQCTANVVMKDVTSKSTLAVPPLVRYITSNKDLLFVPSRRSSAKHQLLPPDTWSLALTMDWNGTLHLRKNSSAYRDCSHTFARERKSSHVRSSSACQ
jgi:hypothetical protein